MEKLKTLLNEIKVSKFTYLYILYNLFIRNRKWNKKNTYADCGEDLFIFKQFKKKRGFYVDVGCHHPTKLNNCHLLYEKGWRGINIDLNKISIQLFDFVRKEDVNINSAVSLKRKKIKFFYDKLLSPYNSLNKHKDLKFSKLINSNRLTNIIEKTRFKNRKIDFLSIDVEGKELEVLKSLDFKIYKPKFICVEIWGLTKNIKFDLSKNLAYKFLIKKNYKIVFNKKENYIFKQKN